jgi:hypothetical protein
MEGAGESRAHKHTNCFSFSQDFAALSGIKGDSKKAAHAITKWRRVSDQRFPKEYSYQRWYHDQSLAV